MWLARLFGGRKDDSEPSEFPPHPAAGAQHPANRHAGSATAPGIKIVKKGTGFDPYNSGAFHKSSAWEKVIRR